MLTADLQFSRATTNRIWAELMGFGIVEPVDDFDLNRYYPDQPLPKGWTVQPSNPYLLDAHGEGFPEEQLQLQAPGPHDHEVERLSAIFALRRRMEAGVRVRITRESSCAC